VRAALIVNPYSSRVTPDRMDEVQRVLARSVELETLTTERSRHAVELAREAGREHDAILVFSGDGTFNEVLNGVDRPVPLGFVPGGRTNVLPRALGLPRDALAAAGRIGEALERGRTRTISLGRVNGRRFAFAAGLGADAELIRRIDERGRAHDGRLPGDFIAGWVLLRQLAEHRGRYEPELEIEGFGRAAFALVANGPAYTYVGPLPLRFAPAARFELGLDLAAPVSTRVRTFVRAAGGALRKRPVDGVLYGHDLDRIDVVCSGPTPLQTDGEDLGDVTEAHFEAERNAVAVLV
jgi:diacylglycerol kinase family enzyme